MPRTLNALIIIGLLTAVICSILASVETHPKKVLAYSTSANLGLMFIAVGLVNIKAAVLLLIAHAFIKSLLFILIPKIKYMSKINFLFFAVTSLSLAGILFGGLGAKELLFKNIEYNLILSYLYYFICFMTGFYIIRLTILLYQDHEKTVAVNFTELISFLILFFGNVFLYIFIRGDYKIAEPYAAAIGGIVLALLLAKQNTLRRFSNTPKLVEKACNNYVPAFYNKISRCLNNTENKIFSNYGCIIWIAKLPVVITNWIEINIMNKAVTFVSDISKNLSRRDMILQNGNVQSYNAYAFIMITIITALVIIGYTLIFR
jgi:NADH:ubiquinone oxidoreductase subunit 5 (subunit L)/multisubunit Na+/H+ antiporter MnhA subunit